MQFLSSCYPFICIFLRCCSIYRFQIYIYTTPPSGIIIYNIQNPSNPIPVQNITTTETAATSALIYNNYLLLGGQEYSAHDLNNGLLEVVAKPALSTQNMAIAGNTLLIQQYLNAYAYNISNPLSPVLIASFNTGYNGRLAISHNARYMFTATYVNSTYAVWFEVFDITTTLQVGSIFIPGAFSPIDVALSVDGNTCFIADSTLGLIGIDVSTPTHPVILIQNTTTKYPVSSFVGPIGISPGGNLTFLTWRSLIQIFYMVPKNAPVLVGTYAPTGPVNYFSTGVFSKDGLTAYFGRQDPNYGLHILNISNLHYCYEPNFVAIPTSSTVVTSNTNIMTSSTNVVTSNTNVMTSTSATNVVTSDTNGMTSTDTTFSSIAGNTSTSVLNAGNLNTPTTTLNLTLILGASLGGVGGFLLLLLFILIIILIVKKSDGNRAKNNNIKKSNTKNKSMEEGILPKSPETKSIEMGTPKEVKAPETNVDTPYDSRKTETGRGEGFITDITIKRKLGEGSFGDVFLGKWGHTKVALKSLKDDRQASSFEREFKLLVSLRHPNVVSCLGMFKDNEGQKYIVMEWVSRGSLDSVLKKETSLGLKDFLQMSYGTALGMEYLESNNILHRDLACRNLLTTSQDDSYLVKVSDFGLSRESEIYTVVQQSKIPVRWSAPEVLKGKVYTSKSDVYSFGITMWEIFSLALLPFAWMSNQDVYESSIKGTLSLTKPDLCPDEVFDLIKECCLPDPSQRPTFSEIASKLSKIKKLASEASMRPKSVPTAYEVIGEHNYEKMK